LGVVEDIGEEEMVKRGERAETEKCGNGLGVSKALREANGCSMEIASGGKDEGMAVSGAADGLAKIADP
jgi:hypothetical protein